MKKILLDENIPIKLKDRLIVNDVYTFRDKNLSYQQNISKISLSIIVLDILLLKWSYIEPLIPEILEIIPTLEKKKIYIIK